MTTASAVGAVARRPGRWLRAGLLVVGLVLLGLVIARDDPAAIAESMARLSWGLLLILCFPVSVVTFFDTLGWRFAFARDRVHFRTLIGARLAGEAVNMATPTAAMGGEAVKAWLLRGELAMSESVPSVIVAKTAITIAQGLFLLLGLVIAWTTAIPDSGLVRSMYWLLLVETVCLGGFVLVQARGMVGWSGRLLGRWIARAVHAPAAFQRVDEGLVRFYREQPVRLVLSVGFHFVAWVLGALETYLILTFLAVPVSLATATVIEAFGTAIKFATFLIPASLGALEGGYAATFAALGFGSTLGVSFSLVRRVREAVWVGIGLVVLAVMRSRRA